MSWVKTNHVKRALREGRPTAGAWLLVDPDTSLVVQGSQDIVARFRQDVRP